MNKVPNLKSFIEDAVYNTTKKIGGFPVPEKGSIEHIQKSTEIGLLKTWLSRNSIKFSFKPIFEIGR